MSRWIDVSSGWVLSLGIHLAMLLGAGLICMEQLLESVGDGGSGGFQISSRPGPVFEGTATLPRVAERIPEHRYPLTDDQRPVYNPFERETSSVDLTCRVEGPDESHGGTSCPVCTGIRCAFPGNRQGENLLDSRSRPSSASGEFGRFVSGSPPKAATGDSAVLDALRWLARHQSPDGRWSALDYTTGCARKVCSGSGDSDYDVGVTSLAILAFLGAGFTPFSTDQSIDPAVPEQTISFGPTVKKGLRWLLSQEDDGGCISPRGVKYLYNHALAALALCEAYGMTSSAPLQQPAQRAIDFLVAAQNPGRGWRYSARCRDNDTSVTGWAVMALKSAQLADLQVPPTATAGALNWLNEATDPLNGQRVAYDLIERTGGCKLRVPGKNELFARHPTMTAIGLVSRIFIQKHRNDPANSGSRLLASDLPTWQPGQVDFYYWYFGSLAAFQFDGPGGPLWKSWYKSLKDALIPHQRSAGNGCEHGSWDPIVDPWGFEGGRVYATALNALSLEYYERYPNVFSASR
jgi:hypothetical protein